MEFSKSLIYFFSPFSCWMYDVSVNWIYKIPCIVSVCANLIFLLWIVFVLVSKLHTDMSDNAAVMKTFKAIGMNSSPLAGGAINLKTIAPNEIFWQRLKTP